MTFQITYYRQLCIFILVIISIALILPINQSNSFLFSIRTSNYTRYSLLKNNEQYSTTVVTAYFPLSKSKHSKAEYQSWLENLLGFCQSPMIIYTSIEYQPMLQQLRRNNSLRTHFIVEYNSSLEMPPVKKLVPIFEQQYLTDPERAYHSVELYAVWCAKSFILNRISDDKNYCRKTFGQKKNVLVTPDSFNAADDLATLTLCEHTILTAGTFGWWGAFLSHNQLGDVLTDSKADHTPLDVNCRQDEYFPSWFSFLNIVIGIGLVLFIDQPNLFQFSIRRSNYTRYPLLKNNEQYSTTVVIAYFPLSKSKHSKAQYQSWLENLLGFCQSPIIIYTSIEYQPILQGLRRNNSLRTHFIVEYNSPLEMPPIKRLVPIFEQQYPSDPERAYHSVELYAVWCAKSFILNRSAELNPFQTKYFLYIDAGAFRSSKYRFQSWPYEPSIHSILANNRLLLGMISPLPRQFCPLSYTINKGPIRHNLIEGGLIGGTSDIIHWWTSVFYETINIYTSKNLFIGKDQYLMNAIALTYPHRINMMLSFRTSCGDVWFAFGPLLANQAEKQKLTFSKTCQQQNLSEVIIRFENICNDSKNVK
ncbi:unnamed protein product [Adineta steineri]|uniref:L-Fucosyltransferase n=2 Tax=Adineta steineri TaxID=433720 RepID=A0A815H8Y4_9BILA|nr:unnamed protein product [Adineta steineri]